MVDMDKLSKQLKEWADILHRENVKGGLNTVIYDVGLEMQDLALAAKGIEPFYSPEKAAAILGSVGGKSTSEAKRKASAENGKKGGRPRKTE